MAVQLAKPSRYFSQGICLRRRCENINPSKCAVSRFFNCQHLIYECALSRARSVLGALRSSALVWLRKRNKFSKRLSFAPRVPTIRDKLVSARETIARNIPDNGVRSFATESPRERESFSAARERASAQIAYSKGT